MEIKFLKKMQEHPTLAGFTNNGFSIEEIKTLEKKYNKGKQFPAAYREFLYLAGAVCNLDNIDRGGGYDWMQKMAKEQLKENNKSIGRPFWVTSQLDGCEQFGFIYLDEDDDDPIIYNSFPAYQQFDFPLVKPKPQGKFSNYINECVDNTIITDNYSRK